MEITRDYLEKELKHLEGQRNHAQSVAIAAQGAMDAVIAMLGRLDAEAEKEVEK